MKYLLITVAVALVVAVLLAARRGGPRITTIEHKREDVDKDHD